MFFRNHRLKNRNTGKGNICWKWVDKLHRIVKYEKLPKILSKENLSLFSVSRSFRNKRENRLNINMWAKFQSVMLKLAKALIAYTAQNLKFSLRISPVSMTFGHIY